MNVDLKMEFEKYVKVLDLKSHPEGGWFREVYRSKSVHHLQDDIFPTGRNYCTSIYFLITSGNFSAFHRIRSDETWHFYAGDPLEVIEITNAGHLKITVIGKEILNGQSFQYTVEAGSWFASRVSGKGLFSLVGCTVAPGFDFNDFELASREKLISDFPHHSSMITELTRL